MKLLLPMIALASSAATNPAPGQFNLLCAGTMTTLGLSGKTVEPYSSIYRVDLSAKKWCQEECKNPLPIAEIRPTQLLLLSDNMSLDGIDNGKPIISITIDRQTGDHSTLITIGRRGFQTMIQKKGHCERRPFTGFPTFKTEF